MSSRMQFGCILTMYVASDALTPVSNFKAIGQLIMDYFKDLGDTESVVTNAFVLVLGECQTENGNVPKRWGVITLIYSCVAMYWELTMLCHFKIIADRQTDTQPHYNSFATASRFN